MDLLDTLSEETLEEWVQNLLLDYASKGYSQEEVRQMGGHFAHHPTPDWAGGTRGVWMFVEDHAIHGVLQSEVFQHPCIYGWESEHLSGGLHALCKKWHSVKSSVAGRIGSEATLSKNPDHMKDMRSLQPPDQAKKASLEAHRKHPTLASDNGKKTGPENMKKCLESEECRENRVTQGRKTGRDNMKRVARQKWQCLVTGRVMNAGNLTKYQRARGIDTTLRVRIPD
jgi:hypothetical protein